MSFRLIANGSRKENQLRDDHTDQEEPPVSALGRIIETHLSADGIIRTVTIKTATEELKQSVKCICLLSIQP